MFSRLAERGSLSVFVAIIMPALVVAFALLVDGGGAKLRAAIQADTAAAEAARAGVQEINPADAVLGERPTLDAARAIAAAEAHLAKVGVEGSVAVEGDQVVVTATATRDGVILFERMSATVTARARIARGVIEEID